MQLSITKDKIVTNFDSPHWYAHWDSFDICQDPECSCRIKPHNATGIGKTEFEAIADLAQQTEERSE